MSSLPPQSLGRVRASTVRVRERFVLARYGEKAHVRYMAAVSPGLRRTIETAGDHWVDFGEFIEATEVACVLFANGDISLAREIGAFGAEHNMGVWRALVTRLLNPATMLSIAGGLWNHHYDSGRLVSSPVGEHGIRIRIEDFPRPHRGLCLAIAGWAHRTVELGRPSRVSVAETLCRTRGQAACEFVMEWE